MAGLAMIAKEKGFEVRGADKAAYPPMSVELEKADIPLSLGYTTEALDPHPDTMIIGNALSRGVPIVEHILREKLPYTSGPEWLAHHVLAERWVLAVAGTHGKTTTTSMLAWILEYAGLNPGFLIGGVPLNFGKAARLGTSPYFVIEADEYDTAFFDKRSKFIHYHPRTLIINNIEFDHADIFQDLYAVKREFRHLLATVPDNGLVIYPSSDKNVADVLSQAGEWTKRQTINTLANASTPSKKDWSATTIAPDGSSFCAHYLGKSIGEIHWRILGKHNISNALSAMAAAAHIGVDPALSVRALAGFAGVKRRMEVVGVVNGITVYDDFAHHPTAITAVLETLRHHTAHSTGRVLAVTEFASFTMRHGCHANQSLSKAFASADRLYCLKPDTEDWEINDFVRQCDIPAHVYDTIDAIIDHLVASAKPGDHVIAMSSRSFDNLPQKLVTALKHCYTSELS